jgi:predicted hotdog family 3-hydroxylacyl-ACP dehydratase
MGVDHRWLLEELVPHAHPMILIDEIIDSDDGNFTATVRITEDCRFFEPSRGVPTYVGIEYIAQTVSALVGLRAKQSGGNVQHGYLLGTRKFSSTRPYFVLGSELSVRIVDEFESGELGRYAGEITEGGGDAIIETSIAVYSGPIADPS